MWLKDCGRKIWDGFLQHVGVTLVMFFASVIYLFLKQVKKIKDFIREIPTDWVLTPFVFVVISLIALIIINRKQKQRINVLEKEPIKDEKNARMVTHSGVWWKIYPEAEYIEDYPYCTCCNPQKKLSQTEWHPNEIFECPITKAQFRLFGDAVPLKRQIILHGLYKAYFTSLGYRMEKEFYAEHNRLKELNKNISDDDLFDKLFQLVPLNKIPKEELQEIRKKHPNPQNAFRFIDRHFSRYKKYFKRKEEN